MSTTSLQLIGGQSPWEIVRAYSFIEVTSLGDEGFQVVCQGSDGEAWPFVHAFEALTAEERQRYDADIAAGRPPAGSEEQIPARAMVRLVALVKAAAGAEPPAWKLFYDVAHGRSRHPSAQAERVRSRRPGGCG